MNGQDKQSLLQDLSARLPYGVKVQVTQVPIGLSKDEILTYNRMYSLDESDEYITIKPYLRTLSSMTEEEKEKLRTLKWTKLEHYTVDWLNAHHFDYRGLIDKGLAIKVTKENNPYKD